MKLTNSYKLSLSINNTNLLTLIKVFMVSLLFSKFDNVHFHCLYF